MARDLCAPGEKDTKVCVTKKWVEDGFLEKSAPKRKHKLSLLNTEIDNNTNNNNNN